MEKLNVLLADDFRKGITLATKLLKNSIISNKISTHKTHYIREKVNCPPETRTAMDILSSLNHLEIAFVDLIWDEEFGKNQKGGETLIHEIHQKFPHCLIIPLSDQISEFLEMQKFSTSTIERFALAKGQIANEMPKSLDYFHNLLSGWVKGTLGKVNNHNELYELKMQLQNGAKKKVGDENALTIDGTRWLYSWLLIDQFIQSGHPNFLKEDLIQTLEDILNNLRGPKSGNWNRNRAKTDVSYWETYFSLGGSDHVRSNKEIDNKTEEWFGKIIALAQKPLNKGHKIHWQDLDNWKATVNSFDKSTQFFYNKLIWRRIILRIYTEAATPKKKNAASPEILKALKSMSNLYNIHNSGEVYAPKFIGDHIENAKALCQTNLGFRIEKDQIIFPDKDELFAEEEEYLKQLNN